MRRAATALTLALAACSDTATQAAPPPPPLVTVSAPVQQPVIEYLETTGRTQAFAVVEVRARVEGFLEEMRFEVATEVQEGDVLFVIQKDDYQAQLEQANADLESAHANREKAAADLERIEKAFETNAVSGSQVTEARAVNRSAAASVLAAEAAVRRAELSLSYCDVVSPITGLVGRNLVDLGNLVGLGGDSVLTTVVQRDPMFVYFEIPEKFVNQALRKVAALRAAGSGTEKLNTRVEIALPDEQEFAYAGVLDWADNQVDPSTGTLRARAIFDNAEGRLYSGVFVRVRLVGETRPDTLLVDEAAFSIDLGGKYLLLVNDENVVERRYVTPGQLEGTLRVIESGLEPGERYISDGLIRARPGLPVRVRDAGAASAPAGD